MKKIYLIGMMGSGKTTVGKILADMLNLSFEDGDEYLIKQYKMSISDLFRRGEDDFREKETLWLTSTKAAKSGVFSTGGGVVTRFENRNLLSGEFCVYLSGEISVLSQRIQKANSDRPLAKNLESLFLRRREFYESLASIKVETDMLEPVEVAYKIVSML